MQTENGKLFFDDGMLKYEGGLDNGQRCGEGTEYYRTGEVHLKGTFEKAGLSEGTEYYKNGNIRYTGHYYHKHENGGSYYGPTYPTEGKYYSEDGKLQYEGKFRIARQGGVGFPKVVIPENFGRIYLKDE